MRANEEYTATAHGEVPAANGLDSARFGALWARCCTPEPHGRLQPRERPDAHVFSLLAGRYNELHRRYHTAAHINHCLSQLDLARAWIAAPDTAEMALWFHDAIYDPRATDNELKSAELFRQCTRDVASRSFRDDVFRLIMATRHGEPPTREDEKWVVDVDLSGFGAPRDVFERESNAVRQEFAHLSDAQFVPGQCRFLASLLDRPRIYATDFFRERYERGARENIARQLLKLRQQAA